MIDITPDGTANRVLVVAPFGRDGTLLADVLNQADVQAEVVHDIETLCWNIRNGAGAVLIGAEALTKEKARILEECIRTQEPWSDLPIFVMTHQGEREGRLWLKTLGPLGNVTILERPLRSEILISAFRMGLRARAHQYQLRARLEAERETAKALRESERWYRKLAESLPLLVWTCDPDGRCEYLSRQWVEYTGLPEEVQLGFGWLQALHPDDRDQTQRAWESAYRSGAQYDLEFRICRHDGQYRWFKTRGVPSKDADGKVEKWFGSCTDIEDQKRISEERRQLLGREQKARGLAELLNRVGPILLQELEPQRLAQKVTDLATQLTGAEFGALFHKFKGKSDEKPMLYALSGALPDDAQLPAPQFDGQHSIVSDDVLNDPRFEHNSNFAKLPALRSYLASPITSRSGEELGALLFVSSQPFVFKALHVQLAEGIAAQAAIALDNARLFAEAQEAQEILKRSINELRRANEDLNQFAYSASHDLQEPLRMVALYSQMMCRKYQHLLDDTGKGYLNYMVQGARRMELLLKDLLDYTQVVSGPDERGEVADASEVLEDVMQNLAKIIAETGAEIVRDQLPVLAMKHVHLLQLFQNVVGNAVKYRSLEAPCVRISARRDGAMWLFSVRDNGIGIASQYTKQVFGLFKRLHGNSQYEGTGIGLAICQKIVERYGGRMWVESEGEGKGSTFLFTLPAAGDA